MRPHPQEGCVGQSQQVGTQFYTGHSSLDLVSLVFPRQGCCCKLTCLVPIRVTALHGQAPLVL